MRRTLFHLRGLKSSYIENSSMASPLSGQTLGRGRPPLGQKRFNFSTLRGSKGATKAGAFQGCGGRGESERFLEVLAFGDGQGKGAMEDVPGAKRIHGMHREGRRLLQLSPIVEPDRAARAARAR